jgi:hypothetical protein
VCRFAFLAIAARRATTRHRLTAPLLGLVPRAVPPVARVLPSAFAPERPGLLALDVADHFQEVGVVLGHDVLCVRRVTRSLCWSYADDLGELVLGPADEHTRF